MIRHKADEFGGRVWKNVNNFWYSLRSIYDEVKSESKRDDQEYHGINWVICHNGTCHDAAKQIIYSLHDFNGDRRFKSPPLREP